MQQTTTKKKLKFKHLNFSKSLLFVLRSLLLDLQVARATPLAHVIPLVSPHSHNRFMWLIVPKTLRTKATVRRGVLSVRMAIS